MLTSPLSLADSCHGLLSVCTNLTAPSFSPWAGSDPHPWLGVPSSASPLSAQERRHGVLLVSRTLVLTGLAQNHLLSPLDSSQPSLSSMRAGSALVLFPCDPSTLYVVGTPQEAQWPE